MANDTSQNRPESGLLTLARERDFTALEARWIEHLDTAEPDLDDLLRVARYLVKKHFEERAGLLLWSLITSMSEKRGSEAALAVARQAVAIAPGQLDLRKELVALYRAVHADAVQLEEILEQSGIANTEDVEGALTFIEDFLRLQPGAYVIHRLSRRVGRVKGFADNVYLIEAPTTTYRHQPSDVLRQWEPLGPEDFQAFTVFENERLRQLAADNPEELFRLLLRSHKGCVDFKQAKAALMPAVIPRETWSTWWSAARTTLKRSPWINISDGTHPELTLRAEAATYGEQSLHRFNQTADPFDKTARVLEYLSETANENEPDSGLAVQLATRLLAHAEQADAAPALALLAAADSLHTRCSDAPDPTALLERRLQQISDAGDILAATPGDDAARCVLQAFRKAEADRWPELFAQAFPAASLRVCDLIARELLKAGHEAHFIAAAKKTATMPDRFPLAFGWVWRHVLTRGEPLADSRGPVSFSVGLLRLMHRIERMPRHAEGRAEARKCLAKLRSLIAANGCANLIGLIEQSNADEAHRLHEAVASCEALREETRRRLLDALREKYPEHFVEKKDLWEDGFVYMSAEGLARCEAALTKILHEDMPRNAVAIGAAAAKGDLRENWEYKAALEERDRFVERASRIREELDRARVIKREDIPDGEANVGTRLRLRNADTGAEQAVTFLGPWDAAVEDGVYSYLAPVSLKFMGKKMGDRVTASLGANEAMHEIVAIEKVV